MDSLIIPPTNDSPEVKFDTTTYRFSIIGESRPENAGKFYDPIINWLTEFENILYWRKHEMKDNSSTVVFVFKLDYFNSTSAKHIMDILLMIKRFIGQGYKVNVEWQYDKYTEDMLDAGTEFSNMIGLNFKFVEIDVD